MAFHPRPCAPAVGRFIKPAARAAAVQAPRRAIHLPQRGKKRAGIVRIENHVDRAGLVVLEKHLLPGRAAIAGAEDSPFLVLAVRMAQRRHKNHVRVPRIDNHRADVLRILEARVLPRLASVHRLVNPVAVSDVAANAGFTRARIDHVVVGRGHGNRANRGDRLLIENRLPAHARVRALPHSAGSAAEIKDIGLARHARHRQHASSAERSNLPPAHPSE